MRDPSGEDAVRRCRGNFITVRQRLRDAAFRSTSAGGSPRCAPFSMSCASREPADGVRARPQHPSRPPAGGFAHLLKRTFATRPRRAERLSSSDTGGTVARQVTTAPTGRRSHVRRSAGVSSALSAFPFTAPTPRTREASASSKRKCPPEDVPRTRSATADYPQRVSVVARTRRRPTVDSAMLASGGQRDGRGGAAVPAPTNEHANTPASAPG